MKTLINFILFFVIAYNPSFGQINKEVHILYVETAPDSNEMYIENGVEFYKEGNFFRHFPRVHKCKKISKKVVGEDIVFTDTKTFETMALKERKKHIGDNKKVAKIIPNDEIFKTIYLYKPLNEAQYERYEVIWIDQIE